MKTIRMTAPFKGLKPGEIINREDDLAEWLCSRKYAVPSTEEAMVKPEKGKAKK